MLHHGETTVYPAENNNDWIVEHITNDGDGSVEMTIFCNSNAELRATHYAYMMYQYGSIIKLKEFPTKTTMEVLHEPNENPDIQEKI